jgi:lysophospholipase L1-like esterase
MPVQARSGQGWIQRHPKRSLFLFLLLVILVLDFALTGVYHFFKYGTIHKYADRRALGMPSPVFHHTLKPNAEFLYQRWGHVRHSVSTNSLGFRDRTVRNIPLSSDRYRILFMGDSFTYGVGLPYEKTFLCLLEPELARKDVEVLNAGVVSYSPAIYWKKTEYLLTRVGLRFDHLVVFLDISDIQDEARFYDTDEDRVLWIRGPTPALREFVYEYTTILRNLWEVAEETYAWATRDPDALRTEEDRRYATNEYRGLWTVDREAYEEYGALGLEKAKKHMDGLCRLLRTHGIGMTLVVYPWPTQILHRDRDSIQARAWREWAAEHSIRFIDLFPDFVPSGQAPKEVIRRYFIPGDLHWNEEGHRLVARRFLESWTDFSE